MSGPFGKEEMNSNHAYDMIIQDLTPHTDQANQDREEKSETKANTGKPKLTQRVISLTPKRHVMHTKHIWMI